MTLLRSDFLFWMALNILPDLMIGNLLATDPALLEDGLARGSGARANNPVVHPAGQPARRRPHQRRHARRQSG